MDYLNSLLDKCRELSSSPTDMALAKELGVTRSAIANYRHGVSVPKDIVCAKIALMTGESYTKIAAAMGESKSVSKADKLTWKRLAQVAVLIMCTMPIASVFAGGSVTTSRNQPSMYIMSMLRRMAGIVSLCRKWFYDRLPA